MEGGEYVYEQKEGGSTGWKQLMDKKYTEHDLRTLFSVQLMCCPTLTT